MFYLLNKNGLWKMENDKAVEKIRSFPDASPITAANLVPHSLVVNLERIDPELKTEKRKIWYSDACVALIKKWEGYYTALADGSCRAYQGAADRPGLFTIGWGSIYDTELGRAVRQGDIWTREKADRALMREIDECAADVLKECGDQCTQQQFDALVSFTYNLGLQGNNEQTRRTRERKFEECADSFGLYVKANGKVVQGLINRRKDEEKLYRLGMQVPKPPTPPQPATDVATLTRIGTQYLSSSKWAGLERLKLEFGGEAFNVASGARGSQNFRKPSDRLSVPGNLEPLPQGSYRIEDIDWAGGRDNYNATFGAGLGPVWVALPALFADDRGAFGFHLDANINGAPGSAGCVVFYDTGDLVRFVAALRKHNPRTLVVNWGLA